MYRRIYNAAGNTSCRALLGLNEILYNPLVRATYTDFDKILQPREILTLSKVAYTSKESVSTIARKSHSSIEGEGAVGIQNESAWILYSVPRDGSRAHWERSAWHRRITLTRSFADAQENPCRPPPIWNMRYGAFLRFSLSLVSREDFSQRVGTPPEGRNVVDEDERKSMPQPESGSPSSLFPWPLLASISHFPSVSI